MKAFGQVGTLVVKLGRLLAKLGSFDEDDDDDHDQDCDEGDYDDEDGDDDNDGSDNEYHSDDDYNRHFNWCACDKDRQKR